MQDAIQNGFEWWNWGATWLNQASVYRFKKGGQLKTIYLISTRF